MGYQFNPLTGHLDSVQDPAGSNGDIQLKLDAGFGFQAGFRWLSGELQVPGDVRLQGTGSFQTTLQLVTPTANRTISFPNATGTVALIGGSNQQAIYNNNGVLAGISTLTFDGTTVSVTGRVVNSTNGAPSVSPLRLNGDWLVTGGANNTTFPQFYVAPSGAAVGTSWSLAGTGVGVNAPANFTGDLIHLLQNGTSRFRLTGLGRFFCGENAASGPALSVTAPGRLYSGTGTYTDNTTAASGTVTHGAMVSIDNPTIAATNTTVTYSTASSLYIDGAPTAGTNVTISNSYSFFVNAGVSYFGGNLQLAAGSNIVAATTGSGTQIGTATGQLLGFYGATPVDRPAAVADATDAASVITQLNALLARIRELGLIAT